MKIETRTHGGGAADVVVGTTPQRLVAEVFEDMVTLLGGGLEIRHPAADGGVGAALGVGRVSETTRRQSFFTLNNNSASGTLP